MDKSRLTINFLSTFPPQECGIATYTTAVVRSLDEFFLEQPVDVTAVKNSHYSYSSRVIFQIHQESKKDYARAAAFLNKHHCEVVSIQHEYGIFGGTYGEYLIDFLDQLKKPRAVTLHSVVPVHNRRRKQITQAIIDRSDAVIVMTQTSKQTLSTIFTIDASKVKVIHHGVPNVRPDEQAQEKIQLGLSNRFVLSTFGLLNPGKGVEYVLDALPHVIEKIPNVTYLIAGKTHPVIQKTEGEEYREMLEEKVHDLQLQSHVQFINSYLDYAELVNILKATDIYISPQTDPHQSASGTIAYAIGVGCAIVATPTSYAKQMLANGRGYFVDFLDSVGIAKKIQYLHAHPRILHDKRMKTYLYGRRMIWPVVSLDYLKIFEQLAYGKQRRIPIRRRDLEKKTEFVPY